MGRSRRPQLSDEQADRLLSGNDVPVEAAAPLSALTRELREAGRTPPSNAVAERHLAAIVAEVRDTRHADAAPAPRPARHAVAGVFRGLLVPRRLTAATAAFTAMVVLAIAGALPGPVQAAAADALALVGIGVPDGRSSSQPQDHAPAPRIDRRERSLPRSSQAPTATDAPRRATQGDRRDPPRRTGRARTDAGERRPSDRPASVADDRRDDDRRDDQVDDLPDADRHDDDNEPSGSDDDERPAEPETDPDDPDSEIEPGDSDYSLEEDQADTPEPQSADETPSEDDD